MEMLGEKFPHLAGCIVGIGSGLHSIKEGSEHVAALRDILAPGARKKLNRVDQGKAQLREYLLRGRIVMCMPGF